MAAQTTSYWRNLFRKIGTLFIAATVCAFSAGAATHFVLDRTQEKISAEQAEDQANRRLALDSMMLKIQSLEESIRVVSQDIVQLNNMITRRDLVYHHNAEIDKLNNQINKNMELVLELLPENTEESSQIEE